MTIRHSLIFPFFAVGLTLASTGAQANSTKCLPGELKNALAQVSKRFGKVQVISGYRKASIIAGTRKRSKHASCRAVDFHVKGDRKGAIRWLRTQRLEVITYSGAMHHIHIATGSYKGHHVVDRRGRRTKRR